LANAQTVPALSQEMADLLDNPEVGPAYRKMWKAYRALYAKHDIDWKIPTRTEPGGIVAFRGRTLPKASDGEEAVGDFWSEFSADPWGSSKKYFQQGVASVQAIYKQLVTAIVAQFVTAMNGIGYDRKQAVLVPSAGTSVVKDPTSFIETRILFKPRTPAGATMGDFCTKSVQMGTSLKQDLDKVMKALIQQIGASGVVQELADGIGAAFEWGLVKLAEIACDFVEATTGMPKNQAVIEKYIMWVPCISKPVKMRWDVNAKTTAMSMDLASEASLSHHGYNLVSFGGQHEEYPGADIETEAKVSQSNVAISLHLSESTFQRFLIIANVLQAFLYIGSVGYLLNRINQVQKPEVRKPLL